MASRLQNTEPPTSTGPPAGFKLQLEEPWVFVENMVDTGNLCKFKMVNHGIWGYPIVYQDYESKIHRTSEKTARKRR